LASHCLAQEASIQPDKPLELFNGRDLTGWYAWQHPKTQEPLSKNYTVEDGMIRIAGNGSGYLATREAYRNYRLSLEYRWGTKTDGSGNVRNSGLLVHKNGADRIWPTSIEIQLAQGCEGDLIVIPGDPAAEQSQAATLETEVRMAEDGKTRWTPGGRPTRYSGKQFWWSQHEVGFVELLDRRGQNDVASLRGEWTRVECVCDEDRLTIIINGTTVNAASHVHPSGGQILLQNEGSEVYFRNIAIRPINP
jgi:hypothetical protein